MRVAVLCRRAPARPRFDRRGRGVVQEAKAERSRKIKKRHADRMLAQHHAVPRVCADKQVTTRKGAHKTFTDADDKRIRQLVKRLGAQWTAIAKTIGRTKSAVQTRWVNYLRAECSLRKETGKWTANEDERLISAVSAHQTDFVHIEVRSS
eukprot:SAG25_NODE_2114_length_1931_cov_1.799127_3_plen_151_part_00